MPDLTPDDLSEIIRCFADVLKNPLFLPSSDRYTSWYATRDIQEAFELDDTGITSVLMARAYLNSIVDDARMTLKSLIHQPADTQVALEQVRDLYRRFDHPALVARTAAYRQTLKGTLERNGIHHSDECHKIIEDDAMLALLRRDVLYSLKHLRERQFTTGDTDPEGMMYFDTIRAYPDVHRCILQTLRYRSGVHLALICPTKMEAHYVFAIKNGGNLYILTDIERSENPTYQRRSPRKHFEARAAKHNFPYQLIPHDLIKQIQGDQETVYRQFREETGILKHAELGYSIGTLADIEPYQILWSLMMMSAIQERYERQSRQLEALSYTGWELTGSQTLQHEASLLPIRTEVPTLPLSPLTVDLLRHENTGAQLVGTTTQEKTWYEARYETQVPEGQLNLDIYDPYGTRQGLHHLDGAYFGTAEELDADRRFIARQRYAREILKCFEREMKARQHELISFVEQRIAERRDQIMDLVAAALKNSSIEQKDGKLAWAKFACRPLPTLSVGVHLPWNHHNHIRYGRPLKIAGPPMEKPGKRPVETCVITGHRAVDGLDVVIGVQDAEALAHLLGLDVQGLPDLLRHYDVRDKYYGNFNLSRIDPMLYLADHALRPLWPNLNVLVRLSLKGARHILKRDVPPLEPYVYEAARPSGNLLDDRMEKGLIQYRHKK